MPAKRRRQSTKRRSNAKPILFGVLGILAILVVIGLFSISAWMKSYLKGDALREKLEGKATAALKAKTTIEPLEWSGDSVYTGRIHAVGSDDANFTELTLESIRSQVDTGSIRSGTVSIPSVSVGRLSLQINEERASASTLHLDSQPPQEKGGFLQRFAPTQIDLGPIEVDEFTTDFRNDTTSVTLDQSRATLRPGDSFQSLDLDARNGILSIANLPPFDVESLNLRLTKDGIYLKDAQLIAYENTEITGDGELTFRKGDSTWNYRFQDLDLADIAPKSLSGRIHGIASGTFTSSRRAGNLTQEGDLEIADALIERFPILDELAKHTRTDRFRRLSFDTSKAHLRVQGSRIEVTNLELQADSLIRLTGMVTVDNGQLNGTLRVGVTAETLRWIPGAENKVFTENEGGLVWTDLELSGTTTAPQENLSARLKSAALQQVAEDITTDLLEVVIDPATKGTEALNQLPSEIPKTIQETTETLIDAGTGILDSFLPGS